VVASKEYRSGYTNRKGADSVQKFTTLGPWRGRLPRKEGNGLKTKKKLPGYYQVKWGTGERRESGTINILERVTRETDTNAGKKNCRIPSHLRPGLGRRSGEEGVWPRQHFP